MDLLLTNSSWMLFNVLLAFIPVVFGWFMFRANNVYLKLGAGAVWFFFLPNTIYLLTDIMHFPSDAKMLSGIYVFIDLAMYVALFILGILTFIWAIDPFERMLLATRSKKKLIEHKFLIYFLNFLVGFGLVLGRFHRVNSWEVLTDIQKVIFYTLETLRSIEFVFWVLVFAIVSQFIYIHFRDRIPKLSYR